MVRITANQYSAVLGDIPPYVSGLSRIKVHPFQQLYVIFMLYYFHIYLLGNQKAAGSVVVKGSRASTLKLIQ